MKRLVRGALYLGLAALILTSAIQVAYSVSNGERCKLNEDDGCDDLNCEATGGLWCSAPTPQQVAAAAAAGFELDDECDCRYPSDPTLPFLTE